MGLPEALEVAMRHALSHCCRLIFSVLSVSVALAACAGDSAPTNTCASGAAACASSADCVSGTCVDGCCLGAVSCSSDSECATGEHCVGGACQGGSTTTGCASNADCLNFTDTRVCDTTTQQCVACVRDADCGSTTNAKVCVANKCEDRPNGCAADADCAGNPAGRKCKLTTKLCVECIGNIDCIGGNVCVQNACAPANGACADSTACKDPTPVCDTSARQCVACLEDSNCGAGKKCRNRTCVNAGCTLDAECASNAAAPVCDAITHKCVACNSADDCGDATLTCDAHACVPVPGCTSDANCSGATAHCDVPTSTCVACLDATHCPANNDCTGNVCVPRPAGCTSDTSCVGRAGTPRCDTTTGACVACVSGSDCASGRCDATTHTCLPGCAADANCSAPTPKCDTTANACVACLANTDCGSGKVCTAAHACIAGCATNADCTGGQKCLVTSQTCVACLANADCPSGQTCTNNACVPSPTGGDAPCGTNDACPSGKLCVADAQGTKLCRTACAPYSPGTTCGTGKVCSWIGFDTTNAVAGACLPTNGRGAPGAVCNSYADCENDLMCLPVSATQSKCAKLCNPTGGTCGTGETCHKLPAYLLPAATGAGSVLTVGACLASTSNFGRECSTDNTQTAASIVEWGAAKVRDDNGLYTAFGRGPACGTGMTCAPNAPLADPAVRVSYCQYTVGTGIASDACTDGLTCKSGHCLKGGTVSKPDICATSCYYSLDCTTAVADGGPGLSGSLYKCLAYQWYGQDASGEVYGSTTGQCLPTCKSDSDCASDRFCMVTTSFANDGANQSGFYAHCYPKLGSTTVTNPNRKSGAACTADNQCESAYCVKGAAGTDGYCFGACDPVGSGQCDATKGVVCSSDAGLQLNFGRDALAGTSDDQYGWAKICAGKTCTRDADCAGFSANSGKARACSPSLTVNGLNTGYGATASIRFTCEPRVGDLKSGAICTTDAACATGVCTTFTNNKKACYGACVTTADCASGSTCSSGVCAPN